MALEYEQGVLKLAARKGGLWDDDQADESLTDPHLWLALQQRIGDDSGGHRARALSKADPDHAALYAANGRKELQVLIGLDSEL